MSDIIELLKNMNVKDDFGFCRNDVRDQAIETIEKLRSALHKIGYDYVELSHEKVQILYLEHIVLARKTYEQSFPRKSVEYKSKPLDDNF